MTSCGFDSLPTQVTTRRILHGIAFNILVVGPTGIGKTTLINSLFDFDYGDVPDYERGAVDVELCVKEYQPQSKTIGMKLRVIETKGFGNQLDRTEIYRPILDYIEARYEDYLRDEFKVQENKYNDIADSRVHCCIYMISAAAEGLKPIDIVTMKKLHQRVCLIPVIHRRDQLTEKECHSIKKRVMKELVENRIEIYNPNEYDLPLAVAGSDDLVTDNGKRQRVRSFSWGFMDIDKHSEFPQLRDLLLRSNMLALIDTTNRVHYEKFRKEATKEFKDFFEFKIKYDQEKDKLQKEIDRHNKLASVNA